MAEAQARMEYGEYLDWCVFRNKYGSLHTGMRIDRGIARALANYMSFNGAKGINAVRFSPYDQAIEDSREPSIDEVFGLLQGMARKEV